MNKDQLLGIILAIVAIVCLALCPAFAELVHWWNEGNPQRLSGGRFVIQAYLMIATLASFIGALAFGFAAVAVFTREQKPEDKSTT